MAKVTSKGSGTARKSGGSTSPKREAPRVQQRRTATPLSRGQRGTKRFPGPLHSR